MPSRWPEQFMYGLFGLIPPEPEKKRKQKERLWQPRQRVRCDNFKVIRDRRMVEMMYQALRALPDNKRIPLPPIDDGWWEAAARDSRDMRRS